MFKRLWDASKLSFYVFGLVMCYGAEQAILVIRDTMNSTYEEALKNSKKDA